MKIPKQFGHLSQVLCVIISITLLSQTHASLRVLSNTKLSDSIQTLKKDPQDVEYQLVSSGSVAEGSSTFGYAHLSPHNFHGCDAIPLVPFNTDDLQPFLVVKEGECSIQTKALNAYRSGAKVLLVVSSSDKAPKVESLAISSNNAARVTTLLISKQIGDVIFTMLSSKKHSLSRSIMLTYKNSLSRSTVAQTTFILTPDQTAIYQALADF